MVNQIGKRSLTDAFEPVPAIELVRNLEAIRRDLAATRAIALPAYLEASPLVDAVYLMRVLHALRYRLVAARSRLDCLARHSNHPAIRRLLDEVDAIARDAGFTDATRVRTWSPAVPGTLVSPAHAWIRGCHGR